MASLNYVAIIGNVGKDPEMRFTTSGKPVTSFSVAVNSKYGETETTEWFNVVAWNKLAETCNQYLEKGKQIYADGRLQTQTWESESGKHYKTELIANRVLFLGAKQAKSESEEEIDPEDIPF